MPSILSVPRINDYSASGQSGNDTGDDATQRGGKDHENEADPESFGRDSGTQADPFSDGVSYTIPTTSTVLNLSAHYNYRDQKNAPSTTAARRAGSATGGTVTTCIDSGRIILGSLLLNNDIRLLLHLWLASQLLWLLYVSPKVEATVLTKSSSSTFHSTLWAELICQRLCLI